VRPGRNSARGRDHHEIRRLGMDRGRHVGSLALWKSQWDDAHRYMAQHAKSTMARSTPPVKKLRQRGKAIPSKAKPNVRRRRKPIPPNTRTDLLTQAGFKCSVPWCNHILTLHLHHLDHVAKGGGDTPDNLLALCGNHHDLHHQGHIPEEALRVYKGMQVALFEGFGKQARTLRSLQKSCWRSRSTTGSQRTVRSTSLTFVYLLLEAFEMRA
jgi:hypothetical protein